MFFKISKIIGGLLLLTILALSGLLFNNFVNIQAQEGGEYDLAGWIWSENYEWISLNYKNCLVLNNDTPGTCDAEDPPKIYKVEIDSDNKITGYAWSEDVGWICFGSTCNALLTSHPEFGTGKPDGYVTFMKIDITGKITGWAKVLSLKDDGWIKIGRGAVVGEGSGEACYDCQPKCDVWTSEACESLEDCDSNECNEGYCVDEPPCITYSETIFDSCNTCFSRTNFDGVDYPVDQDPNPSEPDFVIGGSGYIYTHCKDCLKVTTVASRITCSICNLTVGTSLEKYGINRNSANGNLLGWAWNGEASGGAKGAGWIHFNPEYGSSFIVYPWLQTIYGSIYTPNEVRQRAGVAGRNATYCIFAENINTNIKTQSCESLIKGVDAGFPQKSESQDVYRNALGKVDINGLISKVNGDRNKYGHIVNEESAVVWASESTRVLDGEVFYFDGNLNIPTGIEFLNGDSTLEEKGNGVVIVDGDLTINGDITYKVDESLTKLDELASVAWIVKGDVIIANNVENVVGAFIVLGDGNETCTPVDVIYEYSKYIQNGCGVFFSGDSSDYFLTVLGLVVARAFDFGRTVADISKGSERIIYDGRLIANPPPGLEGFIEGLPIIRDFSY